MSEVSENTVVSPANWIATRAAQHRERNTALEQRQKHREAIKQELLADVGNVLAVVKDATKGGLVFATDLYSGLPEITAMCRTEFFDANSDKSDESQFAQFVIGTLRAVANRQAGQDADKSTREAVRDWVAEEYAIAWKIGSDAQSALELARRKIFARLS